MTVRDDATAAPHAALLDDGLLAAEVAGQVGDRLLDVRARLMAAGADPREVKDAGDAAAQQLIAELLPAHRPGDSVLSEEARDDTARLRASRVWIVDPLDGTREFSEADRSDWAVHVALWADGDLTVGAVAMPAAGLLYSTAHPFAVPERRPGPIRLAVSRTRPPEFVTRLAAILGAELVPMGSAGVKATAVLRDEVDAYVHAGGQYEWDSAAPVAVARAAGLHTSRVDGSSLRYNQADAYLPDLLVCRREVASAVLEGIREVDAPGTGSGS